MHLCCVKRYLSGGSLISVVSQKQPISRAAAQEVDGRSSEGQLDEGVPEFFCRRTNISVRSDLTGLIKHSQTFQMLIRLILHNTSDNTQEFMPMLLTKHTTGTNSNTMCEAESSHKQSRYICRNRQQYIVWVKIIHFSFMPKIIRY